MNKMNQYEKKGNGGAAKAGAILGTVIAAAVAVGYSVNKAYGAKDNGDQEPVPPGSSTGPTEPGSGTEPPVSGGGPGGATTTPGSGGSGNDTPNSGEGGQAPPSDAPRPPNSYDPTITPRDIVPPRVDEIGVRGKPLAPRAVARREATLISTLATREKTREVAGTQGLRDRLQSNLNKSISGPSRFNTTQRGRAPITDNRGVRSKPLAPKAISRKSTTFVGILKTKTGGTRKVAGSAGLQKRLATTVVGR